MGLNFYVFLRDDSTVNATRVGVPEEKLFWLNRLTKPARQKDYFFKNILINSAILLKSCLG